MSDTSIMSVGELIDTAFGDPDVNTVNFKLIHTVLLLIARQLTILERYVAVKIGYPIVTPSGSRLSIREVKVHAVVPKKDRKRKKGVKSSGEKDATTLDEKPTKSKGKRREEDAMSLRKYDESYEKSSIDKSRDKSAVDKRYRKKDDQYIEKDKLGPDEDYATERRSISSKRKSYSDKTPKEKRDLETDREYDSKSDKSSSKYDKGREKDEIEESEKRKEAHGEGRYGIKSKYEKDGKFEREQQREKREFISDIDTVDDTQSMNKSGRGKSPGDKSRREKSLRGRSASSSPSEDDERSEKISRKFSSQEKSEDGRRVDKSDKQTDKAGKTKHRGEKDTKESSYDKKLGKYSKTDEDIKSSGTSLQSLGSEPFIGKRPYDKQDSKASKGPTDKVRKLEKAGTKADKASLKEPDSRVSSTATSDSRRKRYTLLLEKLEEERERVLRVIHQRVDSHEINIRTPTPMASLSSTDLHQEKLLIVEKVSPDKGGKGAEGGKEEKRKRGQQVEEEPNLSVVTQDQFQRLLQVVKDLEEKFGPIEFPFLEDLRKGVPISDALAGLQLASRLEATEKALNRMINIVTDIAVKTPGVNVKSFTDLKDQYGETVTKLRQTESQYGFRTGPTSVLRVEIGENTTGWAPNIGVDAETKMKTITAKADRSETVSMISTPMSVAAVEVPDNVSVETTGLWDVTKKNYVTNEELENAIQVVYDDYTTIVGNITNRATQKADAALKICSKMETDLAKSLAVEKKMNELQEKIQSYVERINVLDTGLSTQMINYQEQLTQMQHDLETGLDNMAEALAAQTGDNEAMGELNLNFTILQTDFDRTRTMQKDLGDIQEAFAVDLMSLKKEIEMLRDAKSDREEVADALRDKAGLSALNGLVSQVQFDAVRGDLEKRVRHAYDKFNSQEVVWQKAIDDLIREINEKATVQQVDSLKQEIQSNINVLREKIDFMVDLLGEPTAVAVKKQLFRDTECLSCSTPARMNMEGAGAPEPVGPEASLSYRKAAVGGAGVGKAVGDGDHVPCIPGLPPPHPIDPRAEFCTRYCGGRHTVFSHAYNRAVTSQLPDINISQLTKETRTAIGDDGKVYNVDYGVIKKPCHPCNDPNTPKTDEKIPEREKPTRQSSSGSMGTPSDLRVYSGLLTCNRYKGTDTPPACNQ